MFWKFLRAGARSPFTGFPWPDGQWQLDEAVHPDPCRGGFHACRLEDLPYWLSDELWVMELGGPVTFAEHKVVAGSARLGERVEAWNADTARAFAEACVARSAEHAVAELRDAGVEHEADIMASSPRQLSAEARQVMARLTNRPEARPAVRLCGYVVDAAEGVGDLPPASVAYIAARAAGHRTGPTDADPYSAERAWQAAWLADVLRLEA